MEVTNLKGLNNLMKADASSKFEFVEDHDVEHFNKNDLMFSYGGGQGGVGSKGASFNKGGTYNTYNPRVSRLSRNIDETNYNEE